MLGLLLFVDCGEKDGLWAEPEPGRQARGLRAGEEEKQGDQPPALPGEDGDGAKVGFFQGNADCFLLSFSADFASSSVADPDPACRSLRIRIRILIQLDWSFWIVIRILFESNYESFPDPAIILKILVNFSQAFRSIFNFKN